MNNLEERFLDKVSPEPNSGCWLWDGASLTKGYGVIWDGRFTAAGNKIPELAHRVSYQLYKGDIPDGFVVMHKCDVPSCVNPDHLSVGTQTDNNLDAVSKGRNFWASKTHCVHGHELTPENTFYRPPRGTSSNPTRECRICRRKSRRETKRRKRMQLNGE